MDAHVDEHLLVFSIEPQHITEVLEQFDLYNGVGLEQEDDEGVQELGLSEEGVLVDYLLVLLETAQALALVKNMASYSQVSLQFGATVGLDERVDRLHLQEQGPEVLERLLTRSAVVHVDENRIKS